MMNLTQAEKQVLKKIIRQMSQECPLFRGKCDPNNADEHFMNGIATVMEYLAHNVSKEFLNEFINEIWEG